MKKARRSSKRVELVLLSALSLTLVSLTGCGSDEKTVVGDCVKRLPNGNLQSFEDGRCDPTNNHGHNDSSFFFLYGGSTYPGPNGTRYVRGGTTVMPRTGTVIGRSGNVVGKSGAIVRGGFGSNAKGGGS